MALVFIIIKSCRKCEWPLLDKASLAVTENNMSNEYWGSGERPAQSALFTDPPQGPSLLFLAVLHTHIPFPNNLHPKLRERLPTPPGPLVTDNPLLSGYSRAQAQDPHSEPPAKVRGELSVMKWHTKLFEGSWFILCPLYLGLMTEMLVSLSGFWASGSFALCIPT